LEFLNGFFADEIDPKSFAVAFIEVHEVIGWFL